MLSTIAALLALHAALVSAKDSRTFAVNHFYGVGPLVEERVDPIVSPGQVSSHVHTIQGGNKFAMTLSDTEMLNSTCTSSLIKNDKSVYWTPKLYFQDPTTGEFTDVPLFYMNVYYFFEATDDDIVAFQPGHRIVIGDPSLRTPPATGGTSITDLNAGPAQPIQWTCPRSNYNIPSYPANSDGLSGVGIQDPNNQGAGAGFPDVNCDGYASPLRADIHFPSCYNPAAGLDDYKNNMQFPSSAGTTGGKQNCPEGWIHTPHMFYEVYWNTPLFADKWTQGQGTQPFVLSNGDPTGYSLHADFLSGWDVDTLQQIIDNCDAGDTGMDQCPGLIGGVNDPSTSCNIALVVQETITGNMAALPGNNPVTPWGTNLPKPVASSSATSSTSALSSVTSSPTTSSPAAIPTLSYSLVGGIGSTGVDSVISTLVTSFASSSTSITVAMETSTSSAAAIPTLSSSLVGGIGSKSAMGVISTLVTSTTSWSIGVTVAMQTSTSSAAAVPTLSSSLVGGIGSTGVGGVISNWVTSTTFSSTSVTLEVHTSTSSAATIPTLSSSLVGGIGSTSVMGVIPTWVTSTTSSSTSGTLAVQTSTSSVAAVPSSTGFPVVMQCAPPPPSNTAVRPAPASWAYSGCYSDQRFERVLSGITFADLGIGEVTTTGCIAYCGAKGFSMAGTEYAGQCFCGNALVGSSLLADSVCDMACEGDASQICGGSLALSVYSNNTNMRRRHFHRGAHAARGLSS